MRELFINLGRSVAYSFLVVMGLALVKLGGPIEYQEGLSWGTVLMPLWATYVFVIAVIVIVLLGAVISEKFAEWITRKEDLTDSDQDGKLDTSA